jgi:NAD(P)-dependent dehydrogenase (short-subunit alcohol dehydrogenase family)
MNLVIVTGTTNGIGAALRDVLVPDANNVVVTLSRAATAKQPTLNIQLDFSDIAAIEPAFAEAVSAIGDRRFEHAVLINNAGVVAPVGTFDQIAAADTGNNLIVNLAAPMILSRLFALGTREVAARRLIVNISSGAAKRAIAGWSVYCAAKAGLEMATRVAAIEAAANDPTLSICSLAPGVVDTPMQALIRGKSEKEFSDVARFRAMKAEGALRNAHDVAREIAALIANGRLTNGGNFDIRELTQ